MAAESSSALAVNAGAADAGAEGLALAGDDADDDVAALADLVPDAAAEEAGACPDAEHPAAARTAAAAPAKAARRRSLMPDYRSIRRARASGIGTFVPEKRACLPWRVPGCAVNAQIMRKRPSGRLAQVALAFAALGTAPVLAALRAGNVPATFFLTGNFVRDFPAASRSIAAAGMRIGDHTTFDADALPGLISQLTARGYGFVTLDALTG